MAGPLTGELRQIENPPLLLTELPQIVRTEQKRPPVGRYRVLSGVAQRERRHSSFSLDTLVVIEIDIIVNQHSGFINSNRKVSVDTFGLEDREEIFCHSVVIAVSPS